MALASVLALMAAVLLMLVRIIRLGFLADFLSRTVLIGFLTGVGIQVSLGDVSGILGLPGSGHRIWRKIWEDLQQTQRVNFYSLANLGAGLSGTFVVNGSPTKTQMVDSAGGRSQLSLLVTSLIVLFVLLFLTKPLAYMPNSLLPAVVFLIGIDLIDLKGMRSVYRQRRSEFWVALITALMVVIVGVEQGILLAIVLSLIDHTRHGYRPKNAVLVPAESGTWHPRPVDTGAEALPGLSIYRFTHSMYYANSQQLSDEVMMLVNTAQPPLRWLCLDGSATDDVDYTAAETLRSIFKVLKEKGIRLVVAQVMSEVPGRGLHGLRDLLGEAAYYDSLDEVLKDYQQQTGTEPK